MKKEIESAIQAEVEENFNVQVRILPSTKYSADGEPGRVLISVPREAAHRIIHSYTTMVGDEEPIACGDGHLYRGDSDWDGARIVSYSEYDDFATLYIGVVWNKNWL